MTSKLIRFRLLSGGVVLCLLMSGSAFALSTDSKTETGIPSLEITLDYDQAYMLAEADDLQKDDRKQKSGTLLLPNDSTDKNGKEKKKCMTVCNRWGEDCIIDPARGRQCRRTCKEFGEECF